MIEQIRTDLIETVLGSGQHRTPAIVRRLINVGPTVKQSLYAFEAVFAGRKDKGSQASSVFVACAPEGEVGSGGIGGCHYVFFRIRITVCGASGACWTSGARGRLLAATCPSLPEAACALSRDETSLNRGGQIS